MKKELAQVKDPHLFDRIDTAIEDASKGNMGAAITALKLLRNLTLQQQIIIEQNLE